MDLTTATPVEIDTELARLYDAYQRTAMGWDRIRSTIFSVVDKRDEREEPSRFDKREAVSFTEAERLARELAEEPSTYDYSKAAYARRAVEALDEYRAAIQANKDEQAPLHAEYKRRGGWTRAFLVLNNNGHVHSSMNCSTCFPTTAYGWLPSLSGHDEAEIVEKSGSDACTVCYPSAPVETAGPRTILHHTEEEAQRARDAKAAAKAEREAKKAAKAIANPDGTPLSVFDWRVDERIYKDRDGNVVRVEPAHDRYMTLETVTAAKSWLTDSQEEWRSSSKRAEDVQRVAEALAHKNGTTPEAEVQAAKVRAKKRR